MSWAEIDDYFSGTLDAAVLSENFVENPVSFAVVISSCFAVDSSVHFAAEVSESFVVGCGGSAISENPIVDFPLSCFACFLGYFAVD